MSVKERLINYIKFKALPVNRFEKACGLSTGYVGNMRVSIQPEKLKSIALSFPDLNTGWLLTGEGEMLKNAINSLPVATINNTSGIPFYDIDISASFVESFGDVREDVAYYINYPPLKDCNAAFPVYGDSMAPDFIAGEIIMVKRITNINAMLWGEPYLVVTNANCDNLRTIKNVHISDDRTSFILRATNPRYAGDTIIPCEDVLHIFLVKGKLNRRQL